MEDEKKRKLKREIYKASLTLLDMQLQELMNEFEQEEIYALASKAESLQQTSAALYELLRVV